MHRSCPSGRERDQPVEGYRELANAVPGRMPARIGDRTGRSRNPILADTLNAERIDVRVVLLDLNGVKRGHIRVYRHMVLAKVRVHHAAGATVDDGVLMQGERHPPDHAAKILAPHEARIDHPTGREGADETG